MTVKTANYVTTEDVVIYVPRSDNLVIPQGSFVKPIEIRYVPKHVLEDDRWVWFDLRTEVFCYTRYGMYPIKRSKLAIATGE